MTHFVEEMIVSVPSDFKYFFDLRSFDFLKRYLQSEDKKIDVVAIGPGLSRQKETMGFAQKMIEFLIESEIPTIIDADALFAISNTEILGNKQKNIIITPSEKEMQRLLNLPDIESVKNNRQYYCLDVAKKNGITCILKGFNTLISDGTELFINNTGNAGMATAGSGDVLTGILAGLKGQQKNLSMLEIAKTGVYLHGLAGDIAKDNVGENSLIATDLIKSLPETFKKIPLL
jgi:NAD(P)H-hydrate epimerase